MKRSFKVTVDVPSEVSAAELKEYIHAAVRGWGGGFHPNDPLFGLRMEDIEVVAYRREKLGT